MHKYAGGSRVKCYFEKKRKRIPGVSLYHQPVFSKNSKGVLNWRYCTPKSGYEYMYIYGENTIEITNLPNNKTNEYIQERLRKSLNKFGRLKLVRCLSHRNDPYVNNNLCYITFMNKSDMKKCMKQANIRFPFSLQSRILKLKCLLNGKTNDFNYFFKQEHNNYSVINVALNLFKYLQTKKETIPLKDVYKYVFEYSFYPHKIISSGISIYKVFGNWNEFIHFFDELFTFEIKEDRNVYIAAKIVQDDKLVIYLNNKLIELKRRTNEVNSTYWRKNALLLPGDMENRLNNTHVQKLKEDLQILSKTKDFYKMHDERHLFKLKLNKERKERKLLRKREIEGLKNQNHELVIK